jgi:HAD superfamily hydrolase (TIGR01549 family)
MLWWGKRKDSNANGLPYRHVLLDFDRTLNDSDRVFAKRLDGFLGLTGGQILRHWEDIHRELLHKAPERHGDAELVIQRVAERIAQSNAAAIKDEFTRRIRAAWAECWDATELYDEAIPFLCRLKDTGYALHLATGDYAKRKAQRIEEQAGRSLFEHTFDEETLGVGKGKREYFKRALNRLDSPSRHAVVVGDSLKNDIAPALDAGMTAVWVRRKDEENRNGLRPHLTVSSLMQALGHFATSPLSVAERGDRAA